VCRLEEGVGERVVLVERFALVEEAEVYSLRVKQVGEEGVAVASDRVGCFAWVELGLLGATARGYDDRGFEGQDVCLIFRSAIELDSAVMIVNDWGRATYAALLARCQ
jgi:hypothetical protein